MKPKNTYHKKLHKVWVSMRQRCLNLNDKDYRHYGGRGITICEEWSVFANFSRDMAADYAPGLSLDRMNNEGNYTPSNCRWATPLEQNNNRRGVHTLRTPWGVLSVAEASRAAGIPEGTMRGRVKRGVPLSDIFDPVVIGKEKILTKQGPLLISEAARAYGVNECTLRRRLKEGWPVEDALHKPPIRGLKRE